ncbi:MAG: dihydroorotase family protein [Candidatus Altiarchaeota archaeon]|nr:dihydroorotase family protein [Candidatus Altiarchaeota archaeon]
MVDLLVKGGRVVTPRGVIDASIAIENGKILKILKSGLPKAEEVLDVQGKYVLPGLIDPHVHFREPGAEYKEDLKSGSAAAAAGGVTTFLDMPNNKPSITTAKLLEEKRRLAEKKCSVNYGFHFGATNENLREIEKVENIASVKFYLGSTTGDLLVDESILPSYFEVLRKRGIPATAHCEKEELVGRFAKKRQFRYYSELRPDVCEVESIKAYLEAANKAGNRAHICHTSSKKGLESFKENKARNRNLSCEVTPHHLFLTQTYEKKLGAFAKMNPPLRAAEDRKALIDGLVSGAIDIVATDHAPHTLEEKEDEFLKAPAGVPGVETMLPLLLNMVNNRFLRLEDVIRVAAENPARIFSIKNKGRVTGGYDADLVIVDLKKGYKISNDDLLTKCAWSPFDGMRVKGKVEKTIVGGEVVYDLGGIYKSGAQEVVFSR